MIKNIGPAALFGTRLAPKRPHLFESIPVDAVLFETFPGAFTGEHTDDLELLSYEFEEDDF